MSYQVLARKWRPGKFAELVGQEHVVSAISNALDNDRLHHAYLFTGTRGVGKTTIARIFSKSLNCEQGQGSSPCGVCATCKEIEQGNYVDLLEIDAASRTKVEDTRELLDNVQYRPTRGRFKVYLIDEVHMLSKHSFNALLKTLEEPPPHVKFLLATTDPQKLPVTILSRCLQFNLKALSREQITNQLSHILEAESIHYESSALALLAKAAQGSMRDALSLTDQAIAQGDNQVSLAVVTDMLGLMDKNQLLKLIHALITKTPQDVLTIVDDMAQQAPDYAQVLSELSSLFHQIALTQWVPDACKLETTSARAIYQLAKSVSAEQVQLYYQIALHGKRDLPLAPDGRSALEMTLLRMMSFAPATPVDDSESVISEMPVASPLPATSQSRPDTGAQPEQPISTPESEPAAGDPETSEDTAESHAPLSENADMPFQAQPSQPEPIQPEPIQSEPIQSEPSQPEPIQSEPTPARDIPEQHPHAGTAEQDDPITAPDAEQYPPLSAYDDEHAQPMNEGPAPGPLDDERPQQPQQDENQRLSNTEAMLALRQQLKKPRQEGEGTPSKKPEVPQPATNPIAARLSEATNASPDAPQEATERSPEPLQLSQDAPVSEPESAADAPPWEHSQPSTKPEQTVQTVPASIPAFLENGDKVVHASQLDAWSHLIEQMPIAGLLKQLALHSSFSREDNHIALELDSNQAHLLNQSSEHQLLDALKHALGEQVTLTVSPGEPAVTPFILQQQIIEMRQAHAHSVVTSDDVIQSLLSTFEADVMSDSVKPR